MVDLSLQQKHRLSGLGDDTMSGMLNKHSHHQITMPLPVAKRDHVGSLITCCADMTMALWDLAPGEL